MSDNRLVYSTDGGKIVAGKTPTSTRPTGDGIVRIQRQTSGRKGKGVCIISGLDLDNEELSKLAAELKKRCGTGGSIKDYLIEIQGDKRELLKEILESKGYKVKLAGG